MVTNAPPVARRFVSIAQAAEYLGVHWNTIRRWIAAGRLTGYSAGPRLIRVDLDELDALVENAPLAVES